MPNVTHWTFCRKYLLSTFLPYFILLWAMADEKKYPKHGSRYYWKSGITQKFLRINANLLLFLAMKHQNKSIWSSFTSSMAVLVGALIYLKFEIVIELDTKLSQDDIFCYFIDSGRSHWVFFPGKWKLSKVYFPTFEHFYLGCQQRQFCSEQVTNGYFMQKIYQFRSTKAMWINSLLDWNVVLYYSRGPLGPENYPMEVKFRPGHQNMTQRNP